MVDKRMGFSYNKIRTFVPICVIESISFKGDAIMDALAQFSEIAESEEECIALVYRMKWPNGFCCSRCNHTSAYKIKTRKLPLYECRSCHLQNSLTAGTVMDKSKTSLRKWLIVMYLVACTKRSINAVHLSRLIEVTYKTAWSMLHKVRAAISEVDRQILLSGIIDAKPGIYLRQEVPSIDNLGREHALVIARTSNEGAPSYYKIKLLQTPQKPRKPLSEQSQKEFVDKYVCPNNNIIRMESKYQYNPVLEEPLPTALQEAILWIQWTFYGLTVKYVQHYLDEFCFRINYSANAIDAFHRLLGMCMKNNVDTAVKKMLGKNNRIRIAA